MHSLKSIANNPQIKTIVTWAVVLIAYAYLCYTLLTMDWTPILSIGSLPLLSLISYLLPILLLLPVNIFLEAGKWRYLLRDIYPMSFREAQEQVYFGFIGAFATPQRAGDYPSRVLLMKSKEHRGKAIAMGVYGSVVLTAIILLAGALPFWAYVSDIAPRWWMILPILLPVFMPRFTQVSVWSIARYIVFCTQLYLMLRIVGVDIDAAEALTRIPYYYVLVTLTPNIPISDPAIRGSWAVIAFGEQGAIAALGLWLINSVLPLGIGGILQLIRHKENHQNS